MTVAELIEILMTMPQYALVRLCADSSVNALDFVDTDSEVYVDLCDSSWR